MLVILFYSKATLSDWLVSNEFRVGEHLNSSKIKNEMMVVVVFLTRMSHDVRRTHKTEIISMPYYFIIIIIIFVLRRYLMYTILHQYSTNVRSCIQ